MTVGVQWTGAQAADAAQAAYFRGFLADERDHLAIELERVRTRLRDVVEGDSVVGLRAMSRARFDVRDCETKHKELDQLIAALDRRFSAIWSCEG